MKIEVPGVRLVDTPPDEDGPDLVFEVTFHPGDPGRTYGPPERCYPPEPSEVEYLSITDAAGMVYTEDQFKDPDSVYDDVCERAEGLAYDEKCAAEEDYWESRRQEREYF